MGLAVGALTRLMGTAEVAAAERSALIGALQRLGPGAPTLCEGWTTDDLLAHLVVRERDVAGAPGILVPALAGWTQRRMEVAKSQGYDANLARLRRAPGPLARLMPATASVAEYFVHTEDARRANGDEPRPPDAAREEVLWKWLGIIGRLFVRRVSAGVQIRTEDGRDRTLKKASATVALTGAPSELLLYLSGRRSAARVSISGAADAAAALKRADLSL